MDSAQPFLLQDLAIVMTVAGVVTLLFHQWRQPVVLGYILAGLIIGPHTPPFPLIANQDSIRTLGDLGVVFLMFGLGLQFSLRTLRAVGTTAFVAAALEIMVMLIIGYRLGQWFGWSRMDSLFLGAMVSITSTTIIVKTLGELGMLKAKFAQLVFGIQIVEDTLGMTLIALLSGLISTGELELSLLGGAALRTVVFLTTVLVIGLLAVPPLLRYVARFKSDEMLLVTVLALCFGVTLASVKLGNSIVLGAFIIGTIIGEAREIGKIKLLSEPVRDMFSAVFFVTIGLRIEPQVLWQFAWPVVVISAAVVVGKTLAFSTGTLLSGHDLRTSLRVGTCMVPIGELSFIIATLGLSLGVTSGFLYPIAVGVSAITMPLTPYLVRRADGIITLIQRIAPSGLLHVLDVYSRWLGKFRGEQRENPARRLLRKWFWQMTLNVALGSGAFLAAVGLGDRAGQWWPSAPAWLGGARGLLWLGAAIVALPSLIAAVRKLEAFGMLLSEVSVPPAEGKQVATTRAILSRTVFLSGNIVLATWILLLSSTLLPSGPALLVLLAMLATVGILFWRFFIQLHAKAQVALRETFLTPPVNNEKNADEPLPLLLAGARLETVTIPPSASAAGKLIRELEVRHRTGASIVGIRRADGDIVNPGPDEELRAGDDILLLGTAEQISAATALLSASTS